MSALTHNLGVWVGDGDVALKLRHTNRDRPAFDEVMLADPPVEYDQLTHKGSLLARAHRYFYEQVSTWMTLDEPAAA